MPYWAISPGEVASDGGMTLPTYQALQLGFSSGGYGEYDLSGGSLSANCVYVGGNAHTQSGGTGVFNQTGGAVGAFGTPGSGSNLAIGLLVGGNWTNNGIGLPNSPVTQPCVGTYSLGNTNGSARRSSSAAPRSSALAARARSRRTAEPTPSSAAVTTDRLPCWANSTTLIAATTAPSCSVGLPAPRLAIEPVFWQRGWNVQP